MQNPNNILQMYHTGMENINMYKQLNTHNIYTDPLFTNEYKLIQMVTKSEESEQNGIFLFTICSISYRFAVVIKFVIQVN